MTKTTAIAAAVLAVCAAGAFGDVVTLKSGQVFEGKATETEETVTVALPNYTVSFSRSEVAGVKYAPTPQDVYAERAAGLAAEDAEGWYELGLFASAKGLVELAQEAFKKVIETSPDHEGARRELGFVREDDKWITIDESMQRKGYVRFRGRWVTAEEAERIEAEGQAAGRASAARHRVRTLAFLIVHGTRDKAAEANEELAATNDPSALSALVEELQNEAPAVRMAILGALVNYSSDEAALAALDAALWDVDTAVRYRARAVLTAKANETAFQTALALLGWDDEQVRFAAAEVLGAMGDLRAVPYLIDCLSWTRVREAPVEERPAPRRMTRGYNRTFVAGYRVKVAPGVVAKEPIIAAYDHGEIVILNWDRGKRQAWNDFPSGVDELILNHEALAALKVLTGEDFGFDRQAWANWYLANSARFTRLPPAAPQELQ